MTKPRKRSQGEQPGAGPPPAPWDGESGSFGVWLRGQREVREIDLRAISDDSKISMTYLKAFEQDRFDILPAPVFAKGFLRQYARYVGLDAEEVVNFYESARRRHEGDEDVAEPEQEAPKRDGARLGLLALLAVALLLGLLWALTGGLSGDGEGRSEPAAGSEGPARQPDAIARATGSEPAAELSPVAPAVEGDPARDDRRPAMPIRLTLDFSGECWIEASVDGERRVAENRVQGESLILEATTVVELKVGDVDAVDVELNGRPFEFEELPGTNVRSHRFDLTTVVPSSGANSGRE